MTEVRELRKLLLGTVRDVGIPIPAYLLRLANGAHVLIDTGCARSVIGDPESHFVVSEDEHVVGRLRGLGLRAEDIATVVVSHLDPDHAGGNDEFPHAELVVQRAQLEHARSSKLFRYEWYRDRWDDPRLHYREVEGDTELLPGVTLIECPGHVPGHQAVLVELPQTGLVLLAGDAWMRGTEAETRPMTPFDVEEAATRRSQRRLADLAERLGVALVIHNHDAEQWANLRDSYA